MIITHKITMDLECRGAMPQIEAVQDDRYTRDVAITLTAGGAAWAPPEGTGIMVRYRKPDGNGGEYNTMPDGSAACAVSGNVVTVSLAPQMLTTAGVVAVSVGFVYGDQELSTFGFLLNVRPNVGAQIGASEPYHSIQYYLPQPEQAVQGQYLQVASINERGVVTQVKAIDVPAGEPGYSPVKGVDYFTEAELAAVAQEAAGLVTPEGIGAAPAGFGLGATTVLVATNSPDEATETGFYHCWIEAFNSWVIFFTMKRTDNYIVQKGWIISGQNCSIERVRNNGVWYGWEWTDPPMLLGVEYRTTERWMGKVVYTKLINCGAMPNASTVNISGLSSDMTVVDFSVVLIKSGVTYKLPHFDSNGNIAARAYCFPSSSVVQIQTFVDMSSFTGYAVVKYTKD